MKLEISIPPQAGVWAAENRTGTHAVGSPISQLWDSDILTVPLSALSPPPSDPSVLLASAGAKHRDTVFSWADIGEKEAFHFC